MVTVNIKILLLKQAKSKKSPTGLFCYNITIHQNGYRETKYIIKSEYEAPFGGCAILGYGCATFDFRCA